MFRKGDMSYNSFFRKGDMSNRNKLVGNYHSPHLVEPIHNVNHSMEKERAKINALEKAR
jgi:hypothetical protein